MVHVFVYGHTLRGLRHTACSASLAARRRDTYTPTTTHESAWASASSPGTATATRCGASCYEMPAPNSTSSDHSNRAGADGTTASTISSPCATAGPGAIACYTVRRLTPRPSTARVAARVEVRARRARRARVSDPARSTRSKAASRSAKMSCAEYTWRRDMMCPTNDKSQCYPRRR